MEKMFKRRLEKRTDYKQRLALLKSSLPRLVVRRSLKNFRVQVISYDIKGDNVIAETCSKELRKYGWKGHCGNMSAAYLTGLLAGAKAKKAGIDKAITDIGMQISARGASLYAVVAGARDAGISIPLGKESVPSRDRISGKHIADYAAKLKKDNSSEYKKHFSNYIKSQVEPEKITAHFEEVKSKITNELGINMKKVEVEA